MLYDDPARTPRPSMTLKNVPVGARMYRKAPFSMQNCRKSDSRRDHPDEERGTGIQLSRSEPHASLESSYVRIADIPIPPGACLAGGASRLARMKPRALVLLPATCWTAPIPLQYRRRI